MKVAKNPTKILAELSSTDYRESFGLAVVYAGYGITWKEKETPASERKDKLIELNRSPLQVANGFVSRCTLGSIVFPRMCVLSNGTTTLAVGDSGGPLIYDHTVIAVTSGISDGIYKNKEYLVFVPVVYYLFWIQDVIEENQGYIRTKVT